MVLLVHLRVRMLENFNHQNYLVLHLSYRNNEKLPYSCSYHKICHVLQELKF